MLADRIVKLRGGCTCQVSGHPPCFNCTEEWTFDEIEQALEDLVLEIYSDLVGSPKSFLEREAFNDFRRKL